MMELEEALERILAVLPPNKSERISLPQCHGRFLAEAIGAPLDLPPFDNSAMDGYAVRASDVSAADAGKPVRLRLVGRVPAGHAITGELSSGQCARLFTGSPLPAGADAVVMQEDTRTDAGHPDEVLVLDKVKPFENVRLRGEDLKKGTALINAGEVLSAGKLSLLAASGIGEINCGKRPEVSLVATGSELRETGQQLEQGQIYESNRLALAALVHQAGALPQVLPLVPDTLDNTRRALESAFDHSDIVVTSGGVSVGEMDFVKAAFKQIGGKLEFWQVAIRPGKPFAFGRLAGKCLFGLPGNPVSAFVTFLLLVRPALLRWQGAREVGLSSYPGELAEPLANPGERRHFIRVRVDEEGKISSAGIQASHALRSLAAANGLVEIKAQTELSAGTIVPVMQWA